MCQENFPNPEDFLVSYTTFMLSFRGLVVSPSNLKWMGFEINITEFEVVSWNVKINEAIINMINSSNSIRPCCCIKLVLVTK